MTDIQILATGSEFIGEGVRGTGQVIEELIHQAKNEIQIMAYLFTESGKVMPLLEKSLQKGIKVTIVINDLKNQDAEIKKKIATMGKEFSNLKVVDFLKPKGEQLHAKLS